MIAWWWLIPVALVSFWLGYITAGLLFRAIRDADEWDRKPPDWPIT